jgi:methylmalonyl-CoA mutase
LVPRRHADPIEAQRARADRIEAATGQRPEVFLVTLGLPAVHTTRATFARNLFEVGGIRAVVGSGYDSVDTAVQAFTASGARLACICSDDATYAELAVDVDSALAALAPARLYLAGRPKGLEDGLRSAGVDELLVAGGDVLSTLTRALDLLETA